MIEGPQYLKEGDVIDFKKDTCLFCNEPFKTACIHNSGTAESKGDHGFGGSEYSWTSTKYSPREVDLNIFSCFFQEEDRTRILAAQKPLKIKLEEKIRADAERKMDELKTKIDLPEKEKQIAIDAIINDLLSEFNRSGPSFTHSGGWKTRFDLRIDSYFHNLFFGDLAIIAAAGHDYGKSWDDKIYYCDGIKSHTKCWPYKKVALEGEEIRLVAYRNFLTKLQKNPRFANYQARLEEFPEIFNLTKKLSIGLKVHRYEPFKRE